MSCVGSVGCVSSVVLCPPVRSLSPLQAHYATLSSFYPLFLTNKPLLCAGIIFNTRIVRGISGSGWVSSGSRWVSSGWVSCVSSVSSVGCVSSVVLCPSVRSPSSLQTHYATLPSFYPLFLTNKPHFMCGYYF